MFRVISLFCGAGGMDFGSHAAGFDTVLALDNFEASTTTFKKHFPTTDVVTDSIYTFNASKKNPYPKTEVLTGGYRSEERRVGKEC